MYLLLSSEQESMQRIKGWECMYMVDSRHIYIPIMYVHQTQHHNALQYASCCAVVVA